MVDFKSTCFVCYWLLLFPCILCLRYSLQKHVLCTAEDALLLEKLPKVKVLRNDRREGTLPQLCIHTTTRTIHWLHFSPQDW